nr:hypothetical protein [Tanacetum cinerariifolium]
MMIKGGKIQKANKKSLKAKEHPTTDDTCHHCKEVGHWKRNCHVYLVELLKKKKQVGSVSSSENGFFQCFTNFGISCSKNNVLYFNDIPSNGIYEIDTHDLVPNVNSIYNVSTKKAKHNLDSTYLWHCRLAHISKKHIKKLQQEGLLKSTNDESFDQCVSCLSGKMISKSFLHRPERATDLLGIIHTDLCGPLRHVSRQDEDTSPFEITSEIPMEVEGFEPPQKEVISIHRSARTHRAPYRLCLNVEVEEHSLGDLNEPASYKAAMLDLESNKWINAMKVEIQSMIDNMVWVLVDLPPNCKTVGKTFSSVSDIRAIRIFISIAAFYDYEIWQMDVKTAFLNGYLDEDIYMVQPEGFVDPSHPRKVCKLQRSIYGLKQASRSGNKRFNEEIKKDRSKRLIRLGQSAYIETILKRYKMDNSKRGHIPIQERLDLNKTQGASTPKEVKRMQNVPYALAVGSIMYAVRCTRPNVAFT